MIIPSTLPLSSPDATLPIAGGKGANLARMARAGFPVPDGFIVTTAAYRAYVAANDLQPFILAAVADLRADDPAALDAASTAIRARFAAGGLLRDLAETIQSAYLALDLSSVAVAVRSSATAEDLPDLSFAGQQDTYLNVVGDEGVLRAVVDCWSSLWTARAIGYRARNGIDHADVALAVVVQAMIQSEAAGVLFTANPLSGKRDETVIDATLGLGEALVSGRVEPDHYVVETATGRVVRKTLGAKALAIRGQVGGGQETVFSADGAGRQALPDAVIGELAALGSRLTGLFAAPQDIEWAWAEERLWLLQSRPITSLYPLPDGMPAEPLQLLVSVGAFQGMLDPFTPLGQDMFRWVAAGLTSLAGARHSLESQSLVVIAGERLFLNVTPVVRNLRGRALLGKVLGVIEPGSAASLPAILDDPRLAPREGRFPRIPRRLILRWAPAIVGRVLFSLLAPDASRASLTRHTEAMIARVAARAAQATTLADRVALLKAMPGIVGRHLMPALLPRIVVGFGMLNRLIRLGDGVPDGDRLVLEITRGLPHNVTTEMDLALWDAASAIKADPASAERFAAGDAAALADDYAADRLPPVAQETVRRFLERYGSRGVGEIDLGRPRWRENPTSIMQALRSYLQIADADQAPDAVFAWGAASARIALSRLAGELRKTRHGWLKAWAARWISRRMRALAGLRETPKFTIIRAMGIFRASLLAAGRELVEVGLLARPEDLFFLRLAELQALAAALDAGRGAAATLAPIVAERRQRYDREKLRRQIPRLLLSDGQAFYDGLGAPEGVAEGVIVGSPVSPGVVEGIVHVVLDPHGTRLVPGEILVCPGTDPAWTPLFLAAGGLVMEVGGLMTHGSVVAREYGIPAVVGVSFATTRLHTGQRIRVDGFAGRIQILG